MKLKNLQKTKKAAIDFGEKYYFTGKSCKRGHLSKRLASNGCCCECLKEHGKKWRAKNPERAKELTKNWVDKNRNKINTAKRKWREENKSSVNEYARRWRQQNKDKVKQYNLEWRLKNPDKHREAAVRWQEKNAEKWENYSLQWREDNREYAALKTKEWREKNPGRAIANNMKRHAAKMQRTPAWADLDLINKFYECCPAGCHVDHIIPLQGKYVSGLHVPENLQWLPAELNIRKSNKWPLGEAA